MFNDACPTDLAADGFACLAYKITDAYDESGIFSVVLHIEDTIGGGSLVFSPAATYDSFIVTDLGDNRVRVSATPAYSFYSLVAAPATFSCPNTGPAAEGSHPCGVGEDLCSTSRGTGSPAARCSPRRWS